MKPGINPSQIRVLVVDDELSIRRSLAAFLEDCNFEVSSVGSAEQALELLDKKTYHVVIIDLRLPGMSGDTLMFKIHERFPAIRFLIHTGSSSYSLPEELKNIGIQPEHVFLKPMANLTRVVETVQELMKNDE